MSAFDLEINLFHFGAEFGKHIDRGVTRAATSASTGMP